MWWIHIVLISVEFLIGIFLFVVFNTWNTFLEIKRQGFILVDVTLTDKSRRVAWLRYRAYMDIEGLTQQDIVSFYFSDGSVVRIPKGEILSMKEVNEVWEIVRNV